MGITIFQVNALTDISGNPAEVCLLKEPADESWMQKIAKEINLSETAFLYPPADSFNRRWFTPTWEVDLCGHATLASAHVLWELEYLEATKPAIFYTKSGLLTAEKQGDWIELNFPATPQQITTPPEKLEEALGVTFKYVGKSQFDYLVEVDSEETVRQMQPNFTLLKKIPARGIIVTSLAQSSEYDFVSRFFAPAVGIDEAPVTGSAHCCLVPFWSARLNKNEFVAYQASARGGIVRARLAGERVYLSGKAVTVLQYQGLPIQI